MSWNYRIIKHADYFALHEVYYAADDTVNGWTEDPISFSCGDEEGADGVIGSLEMALRDVRKHPVLDLPPANLKTWVGASPCPFCGGAAHAHKMFPQSAEPWFVCVDHAVGCELESADGNRQCHVSAYAALASWNRRNLASGIETGTAKTEGDAQTPSRIDGLERSDV